MAAGGGGLRLRSPAAAARRPRRGRRLLLALAPALLACASPALQARPSAAAARPAPPPQGGPAGALRKLAVLIAERHVTPVPEERLLGAAAAALEAELGTPPATGAAPAGGESPGGPAARVDAAVARLRIARGDLTDERLTQVGLRAMAAALGDHSRFIEPEAYRTEFQGKPPEGQGPQGGIGLVVHSQAPFPRIERVLPGSPAAVAGLQGGLELRAVDGRSTAGLSSDQVVALLRGPLGGQTSVVVGRPGEAGRTQALRRAQVALGAVDCRILGGRIMYLAATELMAHTAGRLRDLAGFQAEPPALVVLDLRGNVGGLLESARELADAFLAEGPILSVEGRTPGLSQHYRATPGTSPLEQARVVVLVDGQTGSGAEAVAAALQDARRATVVGSSTAGAANLDTLFEVAGGALRLTIGRLLRASGEPLDGHGVTPDVVVDPAAPPPAAALDDQPCRGFASPSPVGGDPVVARAAALLLGP